jgi:AhpD family alkylhydroperoxidase
MARLHPVDPQAFHPTVRAALGPAADADPQGLGLLRVLAQRPDLTTAFLAFRRDLGAVSVLPARLVELVRLRVAFHNQCRSCMAVRYESALEDGLTEGLVCSLEKPMEAPDLTDAEKAAIQYADLAASNHLAITDEMIANLRNYYSEQEIVELCMYTAYCVGFGRMAATYRIIEELPESFQDTTAKIVPWGADHNDRLVIHA